MREDLFVWERAGGLTVPTTFMLRLLGDAADGGLFVPSGDRHLARGGGINLLPFAPKIACSSLLAR
jgi:hypothetical protein